MKRILGYCLSMLILFTGCNSKRVYESKKDFPDKFWAFNDPAIFNFDIDDTTRKFNLSVSVRNTAAYKYQNIYLQYYLEDSTGRLISKDLKNIQLFNPVTGVPVGSGIGGLYNVQRIFLENYQFDHKGMYRFRIDQFMRQDSLPEILSVGLHIELAE